MTIEWSTTAVYNTIMSVATGVALLLILSFYKQLREGRLGALEGWAIGLGVPGIILTITGAHMSLTWPLSKIGFPFDDIIFGEPTFAFGILLLATTVLLWRKSNLYLKQEVDTNDTRKISGLYGITGLGAVLFPFALKKNPSQGIMNTIYYCWKTAGILFVLFGALNYFTHIGLIVNTM